MCAFVASSGILRFGSSGSHLLICGSFGFQVFRVIGLLGAELFFSTPVVQVFERLSSKLQGLRW